MDGTCKAERVCDGNSGHAMLQGHTLRNLVAIPTRQRGHTALDLRSVRETLNHVEGPLSVTFHRPARESSLAAALEKLAEAICQETSARVHIHDESLEGVIAAPALTISAPEKGKIHYLALPEGPEAAPFLALLGNLARRRSSEENPLTQRLAQLSEPAEVLVFIAAACPHCPRAVEAATQLALASPRVSVSIIDAQQYPELAEAFGVRSVPLTVLDRRLFITGSISVAELAAAILSRRTEEYEVRVFRSLLDEGRIDAAVAHLRRGSAHVSFVPAWRDSSTSSRMGLLLIAERLLAEDPRCLDLAVAELLPLLAHKDAALRGDTADLLGRIGHPAARAQLTRLLEDPNPDVAEIAAEAIGQLRGQNEI